MYWFEYDPELAKKALADYYREEGFNEGIRIGEEKGRKDTLFRTAKNLLSMNKSIPFIMKATELSEEEILSIAEEN